MSEQERLLDDLLASMAGSLVECGGWPARTPLEPTSKRPPRPPPGHLPPPREVFYGQTLTYAARPSSVTASRLCSARVVCEGSSARIKCFSCLLFDPLGSGLFCIPCFRRRHPSHRVEHLFIGSHRPHVSLLSPSRSH